MEKNKYIFCLALSFALSLGSIKAYELKVASGEEHTFSISLAEGQQLMGLQMELFLPEGMTLAAGNPVELCNNLADHTLRFFDLGSGHYLILAYDLSLKGSMVNDEELVKLHFQLSPDMLPGEYPLTISGIKLAKDALNAVCPDAYEGSLYLDESGATAVRLSAAKSHPASAIYDPAGRRLGQIQRGVNIVGGKKVVVK
ncbi:MAG: hypothetical protein IKQ85_07290 [Bacteroidaceae bacterium]|nr:hypothetical protein [Bacteroidaceae bacterium]